MQIDLSKPADVEMHLWECIEANKVGMLSLGGGYLPHAQPMTAFPERARRQLWFFSRSDTDLARQAQGGRAALFTFQHKDLHASLSGELTLQHDPIRIERYWNAIVSAWHPGGRSDPALTMLCFEAEDAQVWLSEARPVRFAWEIAKANATRQQPDVGARVHLDFH